MDKDCSKKNTMIKPELKISNQYLVGTLIVCANRPVFWNYTA